MDWLENLSNSDVASWLRVVLYVAILVRYLQFYVKASRVSGNGGKFTTQMLLLPMLAFMVVLSALTFLAVAYGNRDLRAFFFVPAVVGVVCLWLIDRHAAKVRK